MSLEVRLHGPRALGEIAIPLEVARCANRSTARRWRQIRDATPGGKSKQDRTSLRRRGTAAGDAQLDGKAARAGATFLAPHTVGESGEEALSHVLQYVCELTSWPCHIAPGCAGTSTDTVSAEACVQVASDTVLDLGTFTLKNSRCLPLLA